MYVPMDYMKPLTRHWGDLDWGHNSIFEQKIFQYAFYITKIKDDIWMLKC